MKFSEIIERVNDFLGRTSTSKGSWEDREIKVAINNALRDAERIVDEAFEYFYLSWRSIREIVGRTVYDIPECKSVVSVERNSASGTYASPYFFTKVGHTQSDEEFYRFLGHRLPWRRFTPEAYQQVGADKVRLMQPPTEASNGTLIVGYIRRIPELVGDDDVPDLPEENHSFLVWTALEELLMKEEEGGPRMQFVLRKKEEQGGMLANSIRKTNIQYPKTMNIVEPLL